MLRIAGVVFTGWIGMFALVMGMRMCLVALKRPPFPDRVTVPFEILHMILAGIGGGWICVKSGRDEAVFCALLLATWCAGLELISLRLGWTTFERAHSLSGIVVAPLSVIASALFLLWSILAVGRFETTAAWAKRSFQHT
jgi:hypothetical protein